MAAVQFQVPYQCVVINGLPVAYAKLYFYTTLTLTPLPSYTTSALTTAHPSPVPANGAGQLPDIYLDNTKTYRLIIKDRNGATINGGDIDPFIPGTLPAAGVLAPYSTAAAASAVAASASAAAAASSATTASAAVAILVADAIDMGADPARISVDAYGAVGNGVANDSAAFRAAAAAITTLGGGTLVLTPGKTYIVGQQDQSDPVNWSFTPLNILYFTGFVGTITIEGNGATMKCAAGLKFGSFNTDGTVYPTINLLLAKRASPYQGMIWAENFTSGSLVIRDLTLDGNITNLTIGGDWGDTGKQIKSAGIQIGNAGPVILENVISKNHGTDGVTYRSEINSTDDLPIPLYAENCTFDNNGRLGFANVGGRAHTYVNCRFTNTGKNGVVSSNPNSGYDLEGEAGWAMQIVFNNCTFGNCAANGYVCDSFGERDVQFNGCWFSGDTSWAFWISKPGHTLRDCLIAGLFVDYAVENFTYRAQSTRYYNCRFSDNPSDTINGTTIYNSGAGFGGGFGGGNQVLRDCFFDYSLGNSKPYAIASSRFYDCDFRFATSNFGIGTGGSIEWHGTTRITTLDSSAYVLAGLKGRYILNTVEQFTGSKTFDWGSIANAASATTTVTVPGALLTDRRKYSAFMSISTGGLSLDAYVTAADTVTVRANNLTGAAVDLASATLTVNSAA